MFATAYSEQREAMEMLPISHSDPFAQLIEMCGFDPDEQRLHFPTQFHDDMEFALECLTQVPNQDTIDFANSIRNYYMEGYAIQKLSGRKLSDWRDVLLRVLRNSKNNILERPDHLKILFKLVEFYHHDLKVDQLTKGRNEDYPWEPMFKMTQVTVKPIDLLDGVTRSETNMVNMFAVDQENRLFVLKMVADKIARDMLELLIDKNIHFDVEFMNAHRTYSLGSNTSYFIIKQPVIRKKYETI